MDARFELREHTADVAVEATAPDLGATFAACADGLAAVQCDPGAVPDGGDRFAVSVEADDREALLYDYLDRLIYERDRRAVLPVDNDARVTGGDDGRVAATARGVPLARIAAREVKAPTYSQMSVESTGDGWRAYVVLDV